MILTLRHGYYENARNNLRENYCVSTTDYGFLTPLNVATRFRKRRFFDPTWGLNKNLSLAFSIPTLPLRIFFRRAPKFPKIIRKSAQVFNRSAAETTAQECRATPSELEPNGSGQTLNNGPKLNEALYSGA